MSNYYEAAEGNLKGRVMDFEVIDRTPPELRDNIEHMNNEIIVISQLDTFDVMRYSIPFCSPNYVVRSVGAYFHCMKVKPRYDGLYSIGFQNNEIKSCNIIYSHNSLQRGFSCGDRESIRQNAIESKALDGSLE